MPHRRRVPPDEQAVARRLGALAHRQGGTVSHDQLLRLGLSATAISRWSHLGRLHREHEGVYGVGRPGSGMAGTLWGAVLALGEGAVASHGSTAAWRGLSPFDPSQPPHVTVPRRGGHAQPRIAVHRVRRLDERDVEVVDGLPCTTVARTLLDEAERISLHRLRRLVREAAVHRVLDLEAVQDVMQRGHGRHGLRALRLVIAEHRPVVERTASPPEAQLLRLCAEHGLPEPMLNVLLRTDARAWRVDAFWPDARLVVEVDSWTYHGFSQAFESDRLKDEDLRGAGFDVLRFTVARLGRAPAAVAQAIHRARGRGSTGAR